jgi:hypothetical protein
MPMNWQVFDKAQDDDLVAALARRQADEEGRLAIVRAMEEQQAARANESIRRDNAETNRVYREGLLEERQRSTESADFERQSEAEKRTLEIAQKKEQREALMAIINDPKADPRMRQQAQMQLAGMSVTPFKIGGGKKPVYDHDLNLKGEVEDDAVVQTREPRPSSGAQPRVVKVTRTLPNGQIVEEYMTPQEALALEPYAPAKPMTDGAKERMATWDTAAQQAQEVLNEGKAIGWSGTGGLYRGTAARLAMKHLGWGTDKEEALRDKISQIKSTIALMRAGTAFTGNEEKLLDSYLATIDESPLSIETKMRGLIEFIKTRKQNYMQQQPGSVAQPVVPPGNPAPGAGAAPPRFNARRKQ